MSDYRDMIDGELQSVGIKGRHAVGGKHPYVEWDYNGSTWSYAYPGTPGDVRGIKNSRTDLRKKLRECGALSEVEPVAPIRLVSVRDGEAWCTSLDIASSFGKAHKDVLRSCDRIIEEAGDEWGQRNFAPTSYTDASNRQSRAFDITRDGFSMLVMGFTGPAAMQWKVKFLEAFNAMEREITALPALTMQREIDSLRADLRAATDLMLEVQAPPPVVIQQVKKPWLGRASVLRKMRARA